MKHLFLNLKRFDLPRECGGVNDIAPLRDWGGFIVRSTQEALAKYDPGEVEFVQYFPESHILQAASALKEKSPVKIGCQGLSSEDVSPGGNFGAFTSGRPAAIMKALGCRSALIGHCEERKEKKALLREAGLSDMSAVNRLLNREIRRAAERGMTALYCIGESEEEQPEWERVLGEQLDEGLAGIDLSRVVIAYEPLWSIGPGKTPADREYITKIARFVKERTGGAEVVYGGGLKKENALMLASIPEIDGGLIALTRFEGEIGFYPEEYLEIISRYLGR